jgi:hypothetical protein
MLRRSRELELYPALVALLRELATGDATPDVWPRVDDLLARASALESGTLNPEHPAGPLSDIPRT